MIPDLLKQLGPTIERLDTAEATSLVAVEAPGTALRASQEQAMATAIAALPGLTILPGQEAAAAALRARLGDAAAALPARPMDDAASTMPAPLLMELLLSAMAEPASVPAKGNRRAPAWD